MIEVKHGGCAECGSKLVKILFSTRGSDANKRAKNPLLKNPMVSSALCPACFKTYGPKE